MKKRRSGKSLPAVAGLGAGGLQLYISAGSELIAEGCDTIAGFDDTRICFCAGSMKITVTGVGLTIRQLGFSGLIIRGCLTGVDFSS